jgi:carboxyl-terminal processing protease
VYGGGAITPDIIVQSDTLSTRGAAAASRAAAALCEVLQSHVAAVAEQQKGKVAADFTVQPAWRDEVYRRLQADTVKIDKAVWDAGATDVDRFLEERVAKIAFGDTLVRRRTMKDDNQLRRAMEIMRKGNDAEGDLHGGGAGAGQQARGGAPQRAVSQWLAPG